MTFYNYDQLIPTVILLGNSGVGKDTIATELVTSYQYTRFSFGDHLRLDVRATFGEPAVDDERSKSCYPLIEYEGQRGASTKDLMLELGSRVAIADPLRYTSKLQKQLLQDRQKVSAIVVTDCRKPVELRMLRNLPGLAIWVVNVVSNVRGEQRRLDGLLTDWAIGNVNNGGTVRKSLAQLSLVMEKHLPYTSQSTLDL